MQRDMIISGIVNNIVGTIFTIVVIVLVFLLKKIWSRYGSKSGFKTTIVLTRYTCPHCGTTAVISPVNEQQVS